MVLTVTHICPIRQVSMCHPDAYSEPFQTSKMERFGKIVNNLQPLTIFAKRSILDIWEGCEYAYFIYDINSVFAYWTKWKGNT